ncbi:hypothetical protein, partial [Falsihalocynthiibacter sp. CO-5D18]|uniref:hypothetical protein n=1 Tax=Falsihalocynthiibacter sp. CO-5D18 TaxID=3240872 RepID=UPI0035100122
SAIHLKKMNPLLMETFDVTFQIFGVLSMTSKNDNPRNTTFVLISSKSKPAKTKKGVQNRVHLISANILGFI